MKKWKILKYESDSAEVVVGRLPGNMTNTEVSEVLRRLVCKNLTEEEIILSSLRKGTVSRATFLDSIGNNNPLHFGENPYYMACLEKDREQWA